METTGWHSLAMEIRCLILQLLPSTGSGWSAYASVCKEWQYVLEKENFRRLDLHPLCLFHMGLIIGPRLRPLVKHIWLDLEVLQHACSRCPAPADRYGSYTDAENTIFVSLMIKRLFSILSRWSVEDIVDGLTLELSVTSPSDSQHYFRNLYFGSGSHVDETPAPHHRRKQNPNTHPRPQFPSDWYHDPAHDWEAGRQVNPPCRKELDQLFHPIHFHFERELPIVPVITKLVIRRQCRRQIEPKGLGRIIEKLPRLETLVHEPWQRWYRVASVQADRDYQDLIQHLPEATKTVLLFEDSNREYTKVMKKRPAAAAPQWSSFVPSRREESAPLAQSFAKRSLSLEHLSVAFMIEARDFFQARQSEWVWENLTTLALTSRQLNRKSSTANIDAAALLRSAAAAALSMPKLHTMAIWNGKRGEACKFQYSAQQGCASITWKGTWGFKLMTGDVVRDWEAVAATKSYHLYVEIEPRITTVVRSHAHAVKLLELLPLAVADPSSLWQIEKEMETSWKNRD